MQQNEAGYILKIIFTIFMMLGIIGLYAMGSDAYASCDGTLRINGVVYQMEGFKQAPRVSLNKIQLAGHMPKYVPPKQHQPRVVDKQQTIVQPEPPSSSVIGAAKSFVVDHFFKVLVVLLCINELYAAYRTYRRKKNKQTIEAIRKLRASTASEGVGKVPKKRKRKRAGT